MSNHTLPISSPIPISAVLSPIELYPEQWSTLSLKNALKGHLGTLERNPVTLFYTNERSIKVLHASNQLTHVGYKQIDCYYDRLQQLWRKEYE